MYGSVLFYELGKMFLKRRLRSMWSCDLDLLAKRLNTLLFPKYYFLYALSQRPSMRYYNKRTWHASADLNIAKTIFIRIEDSFCLKAPLNRLHK